MTERDLQITEAARKIFATYNQTDLIKRLSLESDVQYIYVNMIGERFAIERETGIITRPDGTIAEQLEHLSIFDFICRTETPPKAAGKYSPVNALSSMKHPGVGEDMIYTEMTEYFEKNMDKIEKVYLQLGGEKFPVGDLSYTFPLFDCLKVTVQLWEGDDEFPANLRILWDETTLSHLKYETVWYVAGLILRRVRAMAELV